MYTFINTNKLNQHNTFLIEIFLQKNSARIESCDDEDWWISARFSKKIWINDAAT